jgi:serine protease Do
MAVSSSVGEGSNSRLAMSGFAVRAPRAERWVLRRFLAAAVVTLALAAPVSQPAEARGPSSVAEVAEPLLDAVVNISTSQTVKGPQGVPLPKVPKGSPFEEFFDEFFNKKGKGGNSPERKVSSLGSGFVIDPSGLIVTNHHVIEGADEVIINFNDGTKLKVEKVLGRDPKTDLALVKVTPKKPLAFVKFGESGKLRVGDWVLAIGNPFGLGGSLSVGVVSAKQRDINSGPYDEYIQTDAAINKGNSGGPLFNMSGDVIGVNTAIISPTGGSIGIGFAVPSDTAINVIDQLRRFGETRRGWLGVKIQSITDEIAESLELKEQRGALVAGVTADGPAAKAGIQREDVVVKFDGKEVANSRALPRYVAQTPVDKTVEVEVLRKGQKKTFQVKVGRLEESDVKLAKADGADGKSDGKDLSLLGLKLAPLSDDLRQKYGIDKKVQGVIVTEVDPASPAVQKNIKAGDVIVEVMQEPVTSLDQIVKRAEDVRKAGRKVMLLGIQDAKGDFRFVGLPVN